MSSFLISFQISSCFSVTGDIYSSNTPLVLRLLGTSCSSYPFSPKFLTIIQEPIGYPSPDILSELPPNSAICLFVSNVPLIYHFMGNGTTISLSSQARNHPLPIALPSTSHPTAIQFTALTFSHTLHPPRPRGCFEWLFLTFTSNLDLLQ